MVPRAYVITPSGTNVVTITSTFYTGAIEFNDTVPITSGTGHAYAGVPSFYHALGLFGRSANIAVGVPYFVGSFEGFVVNQRQAIRRSGLGDGAVRFSVNLKGAPAMKLPEFLKWKQRRLLGASLTVQFPSGQYDPTKLINIGDNRWAFKPEIGYSERWSKWILDGYGGAWFFSRNPEFFSRNSFFPGTRFQTKEPIGAFEGHLSRDFGLGLWVSIDGNFWFGGKTSISGVTNPATLQQNSRVGATGAVRVSKHQSLKMSYSRGAHIRFGGNYNAISIGWQFAWIGF